jgi:hypothetical protein
VLWPGSSSSDTTAHANRSGATRPTGVLVGDVAVALAPVDELEINPLLVTPAGAVALDARVVARHA